MTKKEPRLLYGEFVQRMTEIGHAKLAPQLWTALAWHFHSRGDIKTRPESYSFLVSDVLAFEPSQMRNPNQALCDAYRQFHEGLQKNSKVPDVSKEFSQAGLLAFTAATRQAYEAWGQLVEFAGTEHPTLEDLDKLLEHRKYGPQRRYMLTLRDWVDYLHKHGVK